MPEAFYRTGQVAKALGTSTHHIRRLCEAGLVEAEVTEGQQWKIPLSELQRLQKMGLPPIPERLGTEPHNGRGVPVTTTASPVPGLVASPSTAVVAAHEQADISAQQVQIRRNKIEGLKLTKEAFELGDFFRARRMEREQAQAEERERVETQSRAERSQQEADLAARRRRGWINKWLTFAADAPDSCYEWREAKGHVEAAIHDEVLPVLEKTSSEEPDQVVKPLVLAAVKRVIDRWKRGEELQQILTSAATIWLPYGARGTGGKLSTWQVRSIEDASAAMRGLRAEASIEEHRSVAREAAQKIGAEFEHCQSCETLIRELSAEVRGATAGELEAAKKEVGRALAELPLTASQRDRESARDAAIKPIRELIAARQEEARRKQEEEPARSQAEHRVNHHLNGAYNDVENYLSRQIQDEDGIQFDSGADFVNTAEKLKEIIRPLLMKELLAQPRMPDEEIKKLIDAWADEHLDEVLVA